MSDFILEYDILESIAKYSNVLGKRAEEYKESLENRMLSGIGNITGPSSRYLSDASDSVSDKINELKQKSETFYNFEKQILNLLEIAEQIDQEVADAITAQREFLLEHHESLRLQNFKVILLDLLVEVENFIPLLSTIAASLRELEVKQESLADVIKNWYKKPGNVLSDIVKTETTAWTLFCRKIDELDFSYLKKIKWNDKVDYKARIKQLYDKPIRQNAKRHYREFTEYEWDLYNAKNAKNPIDAAIHMGKYFWDRWPGLFGQYMTRSALDSGIDPEWAKIAGDFSSGIFLEGFMAITVNGVRAYKNLRTGEIVYGDTVLGSGIGSTTKGTKAGSGAIEETGTNAVKGTGQIKYDINGKYTGGRTQNELNALEYDPAKKAITSGSKNEAKIGLDLEEKGIIGQLERSADPKAEFIDSITGKKYDVKSFESTPIGSDGVPITSPRKGAFKVENAMKNIVKEFERNGNDIVIIDKSKLLPEHVNELTNAIEGAGLSDKIIWWPE
jgi:hypothetical protein